MGFARANPHFGVSGLGLLGTSHLPGLQREMSGRRCPPQRHNTALGLLRLRPTAAHRERQHGQLFADYVNLWVQPCCIKKIKKAELPVPALG